MSESFERILKEKLDDIDRLKAREAASTNERAAHHRRYEELAQAAFMALDTLAYWLEHGETPGSHDMIQRTHDALQERLGETK